VEGRLEGGMIEETYYTKWVGIIQGTYFRQIIEDGESTERGDRERDYVGRANNRGIRDGGIIRTGILEDY
jgi:hypothetical protein